VATTQNNMKKTVLILFFSLSITSVFCQSSEPKNSNNPDIQWLVDNIKQFGNAKHRFYLGQEGAHIVYTFEFKADTVVITGAIHDDSGDKISAYQLHKMNKKIRFAEISRVLNNYRESAAIQDPKIIIIKTDSTQFDLLLDVEKDSVVYHLNNIATQNKISRLK